MFVQLSRSLSLMFTKVHRYNSADINRSLPRPAGQRSAFEGPQVSYLIRCIVYRGSGLILLQIASARIIHSTERNLCKVRLQTSLAFASLALLHLQKFGRKIFRKGSGMTYLERGYVRYLCLSAPWRRNELRLYNYGAHHVLRGLPINCFKESLSAHGTVPRLHCSLATQTQDTNMGKSATTFHSLGSPLRPFPRVHQKIRVVWR